MRASKRGGLITIFILSALLLFLFMTQHQVNHSIILLDSWVLHFFLPYRSTSMTILAKGISTMGSAKFEITLFFLILFYWLILRRYKREALLLLLALLGGWLFNSWLKSLFQRQRPSIIHLVEESGYSFPSGHAMVATAFYGMLAYLLWQIMERKGRKGRWILAVFLPLIFMIGLSRIYLGVHYASDVFAGFAAGFLWIMIILFGEKRATFMSNKGRKNGNR